MEQESGRGRRVTILDVARAAGVSKSTVSRILDDRLPHSRSPNAQKVRRIADELGYTRDVFASGLRQGRTNTVGVIVPGLPIRRWRCSSKRSPMPVIGGGSWLSWRPQTISRTERGVP